MQKDERSIADVIASSLRLDIFLGKLRPGAALRQEALAERFAVSRIPVRDALRSLELDGIVEVSPNRTAFVVQLTLTELKEITDLRVLIEGDLILHAVSALTPADLVTLKATALEARRQSATRSWVEADVAFHEALYRPSQRHRQLSLFRSIRLAVRHYEAFYHQRPEQQNGLLEDHESILNACLMRDAPLARHVVIEHIRREGALLVECIECRTPA